MKMSSKHFDSQHRAISVIGIITDAAPHSPISTPLWKRLSFHVVASLLACIFILPLIWVIGMSLRQPGLPLPRRLEWLPGVPAWSNYLHIFEVIPLGHYLLNSLIITALAVPLTILIASWAGFAMAQLPAGIRYTLLGFAILLRMVPVSALWLPRFVLFTQLGLIDTFCALLAPVLIGSSPFFVLLFYWSFRRMPQALFDSARLEGMHALDIWARIALPNARAAILAVSVLTFAQYWSDFISPLLYLKSEQRYTLAVGLRILQQMDSTNWPLLMAGVVVLILPILILFLGVQQAFFMKNET